MFVEEELFEGNNLYRCAQCDRLVTAAKVSTSIQATVIQETLGGYCPVSSVFKMEYNG